MFDARLGSWYRSCVVPPGVDVTDGMWSGEQVARSAMREKQSTSFASVGIARSGARLR